MDSNNAVIPGFDTDKDDSLQIRLDKSFGVPNGLIIYLTGYIDTYNSTYFQKKITQVIEDVVLLEIQPKVYEVFQLLGFSQFFNIKNSTEEAVSFFSQGGQASSSVFPVVIECPVCSKKLRATKSGRFRCSGCKSILAINDNGEVSLG